jgi:transposase
MVYGAIDLHCRRSEILIIDVEGKTVRERSVATGRAALIQAFAGLGPMRILLEAGTESEWVAQSLEAAGHAVVVADPNYGPMYGDVRRRIKTVRRDVAALAEANRRGWYRAVHRVSAAQRTLRQQLGVRRQLVRMRTGLIAHLRALLRQEGVRLPSGSSETVVARLARLDLPASLRTVVRPMLETLTALTPVIATTRAC